MKQECFGNKQPQERCFDDKIVIMGMSCVGKTEFAKRISINGHAHVCFDASFPWHSVETLNFSTRDAIRHVSEQCVFQKFVLDGWHLSDLVGSNSPNESVVYLLYAEYYRIIDQYRVHVLDREQHWTMFKKWYLDFDYSTLPRVRYWENTGDFKERSREDFIAFCSSQSHNQQTAN